MNDMSRAAWNRPTRSSGTFLVLAALLATSVIDPLACAGVIEIGPADNFGTVAAGLQAGDTLILDGGTYTLNGLVSLSLAGTSQLPIIIRAKQGQQPVLNQTSVSHNVVQISSTTFLTLDGLEITGQNEGIRVVSGSDITIRNCHIHDTGDRAMSFVASGVDYAHITLVHNEIDHAGTAGGNSEGISMGCSSDDCRVHDSLIANNYIHDLNGAVLPIGIFVRYGSYANIIRDNVIHAIATEAIAVIAAAGHGAGNLIERNFIFDSLDASIQVAADAIVRNNIVLSNAGFSAVFAGPLSGATPANITIVNNTVLSSNGPGIRVNGATGAVSIANNAIYAPASNAIQATTSGAGSVTAIANAGQGGMSGIGSGFAATGNLATDFFAASQSGAPPQNLVPKGSVLPATANLAALAADDFMASSRGGQADIGAYRANANGNPGWPLQAGFKILDEIFVGDFQPWQ